MEGWIGGTTTTTTSASGMGGGMMFLPDAGGDSPFPSFMSRGGNGKPEAGPSYSWGQNQYHAQQVPPNHQPALHQLPPPLITTSSHLGKRGRDGGIADEEYQGWRVEGNGTRQREESDSPVVVEMDGDMDLDERTGVSSASSVAFAVWKSLKTE